MQNELDVVSVVRQLMVAVSELNDALSGLDGRGEHEEILDRAEDALRDGECFLTVQDLLRKGRRKKNRD